MLRPSSPRPPGWPPGYAADRHGPVARSRPHAAGIAALIAAVALAGCKPTNRFQPLPPPPVTVQRPLQQSYTRYLEASGQLATANSVKLEARVQGHLQAIGYQDGDIVRKGAPLFTIEPAPYQAQVSQAEANLASAQAKAAFSARDYERNATLASSQTASRAQEQQSLSNRDAANAEVAQAQAAVDLAKITLGYTQVSAPFDGVVTAHGANVGALVGPGQITELATIFQIDPMWVNFSISERDVLCLRATIRAQGKTATGLRSVPVAVGLEGEAGFPHTGHIDYVTPQVDAGTGTLAVRGVLPNPGRVLLPGYFVRIRIPVETQADALLVPEEALGNSQGGQTLLVVNSDDVVEQRAVTIGGRDGVLRVIEAGLKPDDRVIVLGQQRARVGQKVAAQDVGPAAAPDKP